MLTYSTMYPLLIKKVNAIFSEQTCLSYAIPDVINGIRVERYFLYSMTNHPERGRPWGLLTVSMETGDILAYQNCHLSDFMETKAFSFEQLISYELPRKFGIKEFKVLKSLQIKLYERIRKIAFKESLCEEERVILRKYLILMESLIPIALVPYYKQAGSNFFEWGNKNV